MSLYTALGSSAPSPREPSGKGTSSSRRPFAQPARRPHAEVMALIQQYRNKDSTDNSSKSAACWKQATETDWANLSFADIPPQAYDHVLAEVLKGMLFDTVRAAELELEKCSARGDGAQQSRGSKGVSFGDANEPSPQHAGGTAVTSLTKSPTSDASAVATVPSMYARMTRAYSNVMTLYATTEHARHEAQQALSTSSRSEGAPMGSDAHAVSRSFSATLGGLCDRRVRQYERLLQGTRDENDELNAQLEDLRAAHERVHKELNQSYREYDKVQRQLLELLDKDKRRGATTERQNERLQAKPLLQMAGGPPPLEPGTNL
jgi:hypothetical protein